MSPKIILTAALSCLFAPGPVFAADTEAGEPGFERLVGGCWRLENTCQAFEFGLDRRRVSARSLSQTPEGQRIVSEGAWFHHPGEGVFVGYFVARDMGIELFEYRTRFEGEVMISDVIAWSRDGQRQTYREHWTFTDEDHYLWELFEVGPDATQRVMQGIFTRETVPESGR